MNESFRSLPQCKGFNIEDYLNNYTEIILLKYNAQQKYTFNSDNFKKSIKDFLNCTNLLSKYDSCLVLENNDKDSFFWGIECWKIYFNLQWLDGILVYYLLTVKCGSIDINTFLRRSI